MMSSGIIKLETQQGVTLGKTKDWYEPGGSSGYNFDTKEDVTLVLQGFEPYDPTLNLNQQIVLEWLKVEHRKREVLAILVVKELATIISHAQFSDIPVYQSFMMLSHSEQNTVFQMFFQWALKQRAE